MKAPFGGRLPLMKRPNGSELLLPVIEDCILDVRVEEGLVIAHVMEGLLDL